VKVLLQGAALVAGASPLLSTAEPVHPIDRLQEIRSALLAAEPSEVGTSPAPGAAQWGNWSNWNKV
jgi:hypothetical protein